LQKLIKGKGIKLIYIFNNYVET